MIICPLCRDPETAPVMFKTWKEYANHILDDHPDDDKRCMWARDSLAAENEMIQEDPKKEKFRGKPIEQTPVARRDTLPPLAKARLEEEDRKHAPPKKENSKRSKKTSPRITKDEPDSRGDEEYPEE